ncbi:MAG: hypothetical protein JWL63_1640 [Rhodocyclales bacterium]|nr:hypothetical protein [Rhodocyclales bacterium]
MTIRSKLIFATLVQWAFIGSVSAACNNPANWMESSSEGVKIIIGYEQDTLSVASQTMNGVDAKPYPATPLIDVVAKNGQGTLPKDEEGYVSYYEPNGQGGWRICRIEKWWPRKSGTSAAEIAFSHAMVSQNKFGEALTTKDTLGSVDIFLYDKKGRIVERFFVLRPDKKGIIEIGDRRCVRYDDKDRVVLWVSAKESNICPTGEPDLRDFWHRFKFGEIENTVWWKWGEYHSGHKDGSWQKDITFKNIPAEATVTLKAAEANVSTGNATVLSDKGLTEIQGGYRIGMLDKSLGPTFVYESGNPPAVEYYFTKPPVPISVLTDLDQLYNYDRRRETGIGSSFKLVEFFRAGEHVTHDRFYTGAGHTVRHEQLDAQGRIKRAINLGMIGLNRKNGGYFDEDLKAGKISLLLKSNQLYYRVWDYDEAGKAKLVAIGWNAKLGTALKSQRLYEANIIFGTPDGKRKWKNEEEFFKAFDFDPDASRAYPDTSQPPKASSTN